MLPFSLKMPALFESFVTRWLAASCRGRFELQFQASLDDSDGLFFKSDLVLRDPPSPQPKAVLDTQYKFAHNPSPADIQQVVAYATRMRTNKGVLIYSMSRPTTRIGVGDVCGPCSPAAFVVITNSEPFDCFGRELSFGCRPIVVRQE